MLSDTAIETHFESLRRLTREGAALDPRGPSATINVPSWFSRDSPDSLPNPRRTRRDLHQIIEREFEATPVAQEGRAIVMAGPPGAGKSLVSGALFDLDGWRKIDPDSLKTMLLAHAIADGSYEALKPAAVRVLEADGERWFPLELAALVHEESSYLSKRVRHRAMTRRDNIVLDMVLGDVQKAVMLGQALVDRGYQEVQVIDVEATSEQSLARISHRWQQGYRRALASDDPHFLGDGRWVPSDFSRGLYFTADGSCLSQLAANAMAHSLTIPVTYRRYRVVDVAEPMPALESAAKRTHPREPWSSLRA